MMQTLLEKLTGRLRSIAPAEVLAAGLLLAFILAYGPLFYGGVLPLQRLLLTLAALASFTVLVSRRPLDDFRPAAAPALALAAVALAGLVQSLPWPNAVAGRVAPLVTEVWAQSRAAFVTTEGTAQPYAPEWTPLSLAPAVSRGTAAFYLAVAAVVAAAAVLSRHRPLRRALAALLALVAVFEVVFGAERFFRKHADLWGRQVEDPGRLHGTFVNPDHFATFLLVVLAAAFAWCWWSLRRVLASSLAERKLVYFSLPLVVFTLLLIALTLTGSRGAMLGAAVAVVVQSVALMLRSRRWQTGAIGLLTVAVGAAGVAGLSWQRSSARWAATSAYEIAWNERRVVYEAALELWRGAPWTGTGLGTFRQAFPLVQPPDLDKTWIHAHSDVLELLVTTGALGFAVVLVGLVAVVRRLWRNLLRGRRSEDRAVALAALGALAGVGVHECVDFGLTLPSNALVLALVIGAGCGVPAYERQRERREDE